MKERGVGDAKLLKHKETGRVRFLWHQDKTTKIVVDHYVIEHAQYGELRPKAGSDKCWVWSAQDYSEDDPQVGQFALKFGNPDIAQEFKKAFDDAKKLNSKVTIEVNQHSEDLKDTQAAAPEAANPSKALAVVNARLSHPIPHPTRHRNHGDFSGAESRLGALNLGSRDVKGGSCQHGVSGH
jgi:hypothetical protein